MTQSAPERFEPAGTGVTRPTGHDQPCSDRPGEVLRPYTERLLRDAGIGPGMRVLDAGCGRGAVTFLVADLVGPAGMVVGMDRSPDALAAAQARRRALSLAHVRFLEGDIATATSTDLFDAVVGRQVLLHQPDPGAVLRHLAGLTRPGGVLAFAEIAVLRPPLAWPARPLYERCIAWIRRAVERTGAKVDMGVRLGATFVSAGLTPRVWLEGILASGPDVAHFAGLADTIRALVPTIERLGLATVAEVDVDTLEDRLLAEASAIGGAVCGLALGGAWTTTGSSSPVPGQANWRTAQEQGDV